MSNSKISVAKTENDDATQEFSDSVARIVAAFAAREAATVEEVVELANRLSQTFTGLPETKTQSALRSSASQAATQVIADGIPAIPIEDAVTDDTVYCLCCGRGFTMLKRHLMAEHGLTEEQYRIKFGLAEDFPLVAPNYSQRKAAYAKEVGLGKYRREQPSATTR